MIKTGIEVGDVLKFGELSHIKLDSGHGTSLRAISHGEEQEYVLLTEPNAPEKDELDLHDDSVVLGFVSGQGVMSETLWYGIPRSVYGGDE
ncbi:hypothetical protein [Halapricum desulfuricans]|uniref:hypothetical protein n=1 Tax=Halapricum desulfuricans TaxID=2841257 RepID=UPI001E52B598|nr:hypothetical protein [Halapricum desulfuricans]